VLVKVISAAAAAASFGILFNVQGGNLILTGINGGLGYFVFALCTANNVESYIGMFFASAVMTIFAEIAARRRKVPATIFLAVALIPIVPGGRMFSFVLHLLEGSNQLAVADGIQTLLESGAIAIGIIVVSSFTQVFVRLKRRMGEIL